MSGTSRHLSNRLAIEGGSPVRDTPLPWELPGAYYIGEEEKRLVNQLMDANSSRARSNSPYRAAANAEL